MGKEAKEWKTSWGREFLESVEILHFATLGEDGAPIVRPVNFLYQNGKIYIHSGPKSGKISQIRRDPRVCLEAVEIFACVPAKENPCTATYSYRSVILTGTARVIEGRSRKQIILRKMMEKYQPNGGYREVSIKDAEMVAIIEVEIHTFSEKNHLREQT